MQFALLIYESPEAFEARKSDGTDPYTGAWRAYHKALVEAGVFVGGQGIGNVIGRPIDRLLEQLVPGAAAQSGGFG